MSTRIRVVLFFAAAITWNPLASASRYEFVSLTGDFAQGSAPVSLLEEQLGQGWIPFPRDNTPYIFGFDTPLGWRSYADFWGFNFTLSTGRETLYANGNLVQPSLPGVGGFFSANFVTGVDGIAAWNGTYQAGPTTYTASGTGRWVQEGAAAAVPDQGSTFLLMALAAGVLPAWNALRKLRQSESLRADCRRGRGASYS